MDDIAQNKDKLSKVSVWAFSIGTAIGWGSFVVTTNTYLKTAGVAGSIIALLIGAAIMLVISRNYHFLMNRFANMGGIFTFTSETLGADFGFTSTWFLVLTYLAIFWANATSLPLFTKYLFGNVLKFGIKYTIFGYTIYINEAFLSISAILLTGLGCIHIRKLLSKINVALVFLFTLAITFCTAFCLLSKRNDFVSGSQFSSFSSTLPQIFKVACISPWAFIGFETISNATMDFGFSKKNSFSILSTSILVTTALYIFVLLLSSSVYPPQYASFFAYISDLGNLSGLEGVPAFYVARHYLGDTGLVLIGASLLALVVTSLIGNTFALSRLLYGLARDEVLPERFGQINERGIPAQAVLLVLALSLFAPFLGRTTIGWTVDVTTIGATLVYGLVSAAALKTARQQHDRTAEWTGRVGVGAMCVFGTLLLLPSLFFSTSLEPESYFIFTFWSVLGFFLFGRLQRLDRQKRFGQTAVVWIALLTLILFASVAWMGRSSYDTSAAIVDDIHDYLEGKADVTSYWMGEDAYLEAQKDALRDAYTRNTVMIVTLFSLSIVAWIRSFSALRSRAEQSEERLDTVSNIAYTDRLTRVRSRHAYAEREQGINADIASGEAKPFALVVCDINDLKRVNDTQGHHAGDEYIRSACHVICEIYSHSPVFRVGGDEFVVLLQGRDFESRHELLLELENYNEQNAQTSEPKIAAGMADFDSEGDWSMRMVFERADTLMYRRKRELKA